MATAHDVASYILKKMGSMTAMKLQKLVYYSQAWHLVWEDEPLFGQEIQAWANGPVVPALYSEHRGLFSVSESDISSTVKLRNSELSTVDAVVDFYGGKSAMELSDLTHSEGPWRDARGDLPPGARSTERITDAAMAEYYGSL